MIELIETREAPLPLGHYSQALKYKGTLYVSGILPIAMEGEPFKARPFGEQVDLVLAHAQAILRKAGAQAHDILRASVYVTDIREWSAFNEKYARFVGEHKPARAVIPVPKLHHGFDIELELIARIQDDDKDASTQK